MAKAKTKASTAPQVECKCCGGTGQVPISPLLAAVLDVLGDKGLCMGVIGKGLGTTTQVANHRINKLLALGLVVDHYDDNGKRLYYVAGKAPKTKGGGKRAAKKGGKK